MIVLIVARLEEKLKGIGNFISSIDDELLDKIKIRIIGSGADSENYRKYIKENKLEATVELVGALSEDKVVNEIKYCDVFCLPSYSDPSPLALVEAIIIGAPVFISINCGNHFEAVEEGKNGYIFDPNSEVEINKKLRLLLESRGSFDGLSSRSKFLANKNFNMHHIVENIYKSF